MWTRRAESSYPIHPLHDTSVKLHWTLLSLLLCVYAGCAAFYIFASNTSMQITQFTRKLLLEIERMKEKEDATLEYIIRLTKQQEQRIQRQNALMQNLMSQSEVIFADLEIISMMYERRLPMAGLSNNVTAFDLLGTVADLSYSMETARRRTENIVRELWYFVHDQIKDLNMNIVAEKELIYGIGRTTQMLNPQDVQETQDFNNRISHPAVSNDSMTYFEEQDLNKTSLTEGETTLNMSKALEQGDEQTASLTGASSPEDSRSAERNDPNSFVNVIDHKLQLVTRELTGYRRALTDAFAMLRNVDNSEHIRQIMSRDLGSLVHRRLDFIQHPKDCRKAQKLLCKMKACGFGCNFHHFVYCLIMAYARNKTLLLSMPLSWTPLFDPPSKTCDISDPSLTTRFLNTPEEDDSNQFQNATSHTRIVDNEELPSYESLPIIEDLPGQDEDYIPLTVPKDLAPKLAIFHGNPAAWWVGQIASYLFKPSPDLTNHIKLLQRKLGFSTPIVGVHVRRTDKLAAEAAYHSLEEYMLHVGDFYDQLQRSQPAVTRRVFLATDDSTLLHEAKEKYPNYTFLSDANASKITIDERDRVSSVLGIATDIYFLSRSDFLVCTFSSQVCRLAYELMQTLHGDASGKFRSLDDIYYFGGQLKHHMVAVESYQADPDRPGTISLEKGDKVCVAGNHWNGFSKGLNERTSEKGLYPSYMVEDTLASFPMPVYSNVP